MQTTTTIENWMHSDHISAPLTYSILYSKLATENTRREVLAKMVISCPSEWIHGFIKYCADVLNINQLAVLTVFVETRDRLIDQCTILDQTYHQKLLTKIDRYNIANEDYHSLWK